MEPFYIVNQSGKLIPVFPLLHDNNDNSFVLVDGNVCVLDEISGELVGEDE